jgi:two-component system, OmpR family, alkaline phosphatase synthesis response regulator PhoP
MNENILLIEDEEALALTLGDRLRAEGYVVNCARDGNEGLNKATRLPFNAIILDVMLPGKNGFDVCREIRQAGLATPILMLTARGEAADKIVGLKLGADDYVTKPFDMLELMARMEALLRRTPGKAGQGSVQHVRSLRIDFRGTEVSRAGKVVSLSTREFQLLHYFLDHGGETLSRDQILREVWGYNVRAFTRTVDVHVAGLRQKLEDDPKHPSLIVTVPGFGYKLVP